MKKYLILFTFSLFLFGCETKDTPQTNGSSAQYSENTSAVISVEPKSGNQVPNFSWTNEKGEKISLADAAKGKSVLINFWATWCGPCVREIPDLVALNNDIKNDDALIIGISVDRDGDALALVSNFAKEKNMKYQIIIDDGNLEKAFGGIRGIPTTFFVNKNGEIKKKLVGLQSKETFASELKAVM
ncbi:MAG: TlpA family protein disulfide reductase [Bacteroidetes bacterium]|nr:TlpA family protein disulfide reductase [Bacteroidota bacterium]